MGILSKATAVLLLPLAVWGQATLVTRVISSPAATIIGTSQSSVDSFQGIPYQVPPVGTLRLYRPSPLSTPLGTIMATAVPWVCPQFNRQSSGPGPYQKRDLGLKGRQASTPPDCQNGGSQGGTASENCLTVTVQAPTSSTRAKLLPVIFFIHGGGWNGGQHMDGGNLIRRSIDLGIPIVWVTVQYRLNAFGFLGGKQVLGAKIGNLGLLDQRMALQWVADNIANFNGDPRKVTIMGESAGAYSVFDQMALNNGNNMYNGYPLFRGAIMSSGSVLPTYPIDSAFPQNIYDTVVAASPCATMADTATLACLRTLTCDQFGSAAYTVQANFGGNAVFPYMPRPDSYNLTDSPDNLAKAGLFTPVPYIVGIQQDEGTLFTHEVWNQKNLNSDSDLQAFLQNEYYPYATGNTIPYLTALIPDDQPNGQPLGSPFGSGSLYNHYPQYKRYAAFVGDLKFILPRRLLLDSTSSTVPSLNGKTWSYMSTYNRMTGDFGTTHGSDVGFFLNNVPTSSVDATVTAYFLNFANNLNPNPSVSSPFLANWPSWNAAKQVLNISSDVSGGLIPDTFRNNTYTYMLSPFVILKA